MNNFTSCEILCANSFSLDQTATHFVEEFGFLYEDPMDAIEDTGQDSDSDSTGKSDLLNRNLDVSRASCDSGETGMNHVTSNYQTDDSCLTSDSTTEAEAGGNSTPSPTTLHAGSSEIAKRKKKKKKARTTGDIEKRMAHTALHNQRRRAVSRQKKKDAQSANAAERRVSNTTTSDVRIFTEAEVVHSEMKPERVKRQSSAFQSIPVTREPSGNTNRRRTCQSQPVESTTASSEQAPNCSRCDSESSQEDSNPEVTRLVEDGYLYVKNVKGKAQIIVDCNGRIFFVKVKSPENWDEIVRHVYQIIQYICQRASESNDGEGQRPTSTRHIRPEDCIQIIFGYIFPQGGLSPRSQNVPEFFRPYVNDLLHNPWVQKYMNHITRCFRSWFPRHAFVYAEVKKRLDLDGDLNHGIFQDSLFCGTTFNLGPYGITIRHRDSRNLVGGLCAICVFGRFNHETSGQFIMEEAKVIVELREGDIVFMPSSGITHKNAPLRAGESRSSIVQYTAGGLFQWIWQGKKTLSKSDMKWKTGVRASVGAIRWKEMYELFPTLDELENAKKCRLMGLRDIEENILAGRSYLFPKTV